MLDVRLSDGPGQIRKKRKLQGYINFFVENSLLLILGTVTGLVWANVSIETYGEISHYLHFVINDMGLLLLGLRQGGV